MTVQHMQVREDKGVSRAVHELFSEDTACVTCSFDSNVCDRDTEQGTIHSLITLDVCFETITGA